MFINDNAKPNVVRNAQSKTMELGWKIQYVLKRTRYMCGIHKLLNIMEDMYKE